MTTNKEPGMTAPTFATFTEPVLTEGDTFKPKENYNKPLIVRIIEVKTGIVTEFTPEPGGEGVIVDLVDLVGRPEEPYREVLWMGGAVVDGLKPLVGQVAVIRFEERKAKNGRKYPAPTPSTAEDVALATRYYAAKGDPFAQTFASVKTPDTSDAPF